MLLETDAYIREFLVRSGLDGPVSTAELHYALGRDLLERQPGCEQYSVVAAAAATGVPIYTSSPGDSSIGMNIAYHELMNGSRLMVDPNKDVNEVCAFILAGKKNGCVILGGGSPKNFYLQGQPTLWEVYGIPKGGNDYFIQITTDQVVWGGLSGATPAEAVSWGKVNPGVLPDTVVAYVDSTIAFPLFCEYAVGAAAGQTRAKGAGPQARRTGGSAPSRGQEATRDQPAPAPSAEAHARTSKDTGEATWARCLRSSRPHAERLSGQPRVYIDANVPAGLVAFMRTDLHWDVLFVMEHDDLRRARDGEHYRLARQLRRTLITLDRDYLDDTQVSPARSGGVLVLAAPGQRGFRVLLTRLDREVFRRGPRCRSRAQAARARGLGRRMTRRDCDRPAAIWSCPIAWSTARARSSIDGR